MNVVSKFRTGYWIRQFISLSGMLCIIIFSIYLSTENREINYYSVYFFIAINAGLFFIYGIFRFLFKELKQITVKDNGIEIKYIISKKIEFILYTEIIKFTTRRITTKIGGGRTPGYYELEIHLKNGRFTKFDQDAYDNYNEVKNNIYFNKKKAHNL